ncbi:MAG: helix-turn-helix domain-containing protein [Anaerolineae bacterium]|nr:helix-turn-helix domain-containing protein [Anaerolineae bacterium]
MVTTVTLADVLGLALPPGTQVLAGAERLLVPISWVCVMRPSPPAFPHLEGGELALVAMSDLLLLDGRWTLTRLVRDLAGAGVAAVAVSGEAPPDAVAEAQAAGIPLLLLPREVRLPLLERAVIRLIVDRQAQVEHFGGEVARQLTQASIENRGWAGLAQIIARVSGKGVVVQDAGFAILAQEMPSGLSFLPKPLAPDDPELRVWLSRLALRDTIPPTHEWPVENGTARLVGVIVTEGQPGGYISLLGPADSFASDDHVITERGAVAGALELAKERAISGAETQRRGALWADLLAGVGAADGSLARRAREWHLDLDVAFHVLMLGSDPPLNGLQRDRLAQRLEAELLNRRLHGLVVGQGERAIALLPALAEGRGRTLALGLLAALEGNFPGLRLTAGISRPATGLGALRRAAEETGTALALALLPQGTTRAVEGGELGLYRLLLPLRGTEALAAFHEETLGPLAEYDRANGTDLLHTLETYFAQGCNLSRTAEALFIHRNSLLYRMERIAAITGLDLEDPEARLRLQVALKARHIR